MKGWSNDLPLSIPARDTANRPFAPYMCQAQCFHGIRTLLVVLQIDSEKPWMIDFLHFAGKESSSKGETSTTVMQTIVTIFAQDPAINYQRPLG